MPNKPKSSNKPGSFIDPSTYKKDPGLSKSDLDNVSSDASDDMVSVPKAQLDEMAEKLAESG